MLNAPRQNTIALKQTLKQCLVPPMQVRQVKKTDSALEVVASPLVNRQQQQQRQLRNESLL